MRDLGVLTSDDFAPLEGAVFETSEGADAIDLVLTAVERSRLSPDQPRPFSLLFRGPPGRYLPQGIYTLTNADFGTAEIFLVPVAGGEEGCTVEAIFT